MVDRSRPSRIRVARRSGLRLPVADSGIPTDSMADIAFLLIIYFMLTMVFSATKGMNLPPSDETPPTAAPQESIYIRVLPGGRITVDGRPIALDGLLGYVVPKLRINATKPVILHADARASYQEMIRVYDELLSSERRAGVRIRSLAIPTEGEIREYVEALGYNPFAMDGR